MSTIKIKNRIIGEGNPVYIIAEMSANHSGSIGKAKEIIHAAREAGADCLKIQTYTPDTITMNCDNEYFRISEGLWKGENLYSLYGKAYTPWEWQAELKAEADKVGIDFFSTPFDPTAVDFLESIGMEFYKIASFEVTDIPLLKRTAATGKPIIMSTGMATLAEITEAVDTIRAVGNNQIALLKCSSAYPADPADMNLRTIKYLAEKFNLTIGLSDHTIDNMSSLLAVALGASIIEKHFCIERDDNPDAAFSLTYGEFEGLVKTVRAAESAMGRVSFDLSEKEQKSLRFRKSIFVTADMKKGEVFSEKNMRVIRPSFGMHPRNYDSVLGKRAKTDINAGTPLCEDLIE